MFSSLPVPTRRARYNEGRPGMPSGVGVAVRSVEDFMKYLLLL